MGVDPSSGDVYIADGFGHRVNKFEWNGTPLFAWGVGIVDGKEEEETCTTTCIESYYQPFEPQTAFTPFLANAGPTAVDPTGEHDLYVVDTNGGYGRIEKFKPNGEFLFAFGGDTVAYGANDSTNNAVQVLKVEATGGHYELRFEYPWARAYSGRFTGGSETSSIQATASAAEIEAAINNVGSISGPLVGGKVSVKEIATREFEITFESNLGGDKVSVLRPEYAEGQFGSSLTGGAEKAEVEVKNQGGAAEVCDKGEHCKWGGIGTAPGEFMNGEPYQGVFYDAFPSRGPIIAVGPTGTVYVGDNKRIQEFNSEGEYIGQINLSTPAGDNNLTRAVAVDSSGDIFVLSELTNIKEEEEKQHSEIKRTRLPLKEFKPSGELLREFKIEPEGKPVRQRIIAVDPAGDVFVGSEINNSDEPLFAYEFSGYKPDGTYYAQFTSPEITHIYEEFAVGQAAVGKNNYLYVTVALSSYGSPPSHVVAMKLPESGEPKVEAKPPTNIEPTTATLHGIVNPEGHNTEIHFEYGETESYGHSTAPTPIGLVISKDPVQASLSGLKPGTLYHARLVAESHCKESEPTVVCKAVTPDETFEALTPVSVRNLTTQTVKPELVTLKAELNPNGQASNYTFHVGEDTSYNTGSQEGRLEVGNEFEKIEVTFINLKPNTTYHYQLVAENAYDAQYGGPYESADLTFTTERSAAEEREAEDCPQNGSVHGEVTSNLREENNSLLLPDCRAYEQITPTEKNGGEAFPYVGFSPNGERALWYSEGAFAGATGNQLFIPYLSQRSPSGWTTQALVRRPEGPPIEPILSGLNFTPEMDRWLYYESRGLNAEEASYEQSSVYLSMGLADGSTIVHATPTISLVEGQPTEVYVFAEVQEASSDFSRLYIVTSRKDLSSDPRPDEDFGGGSGHGSRVYEVSGVGGPSPAMRLIAEVPVGLDSGSHCEIDNEGTFDLRGARMGSTEGRQYFYTGPIEEEGGKPCGEGQPNPIGIFARTAGPNESGTTTQLNVPWQCTAGHPCSGAAPITPRYVGAAENGSRVWFTTEQPLVNGDTDTISNGKTGRDLYVANLNTGTGQLTSLAQASAGEATPSHPTAGQNADIGETGVTEEGDDKETGAVIVSADGSHGAFESPAVLTTESNSVGDSAENGANNLYVYDANTNKTNFVAKLCSGPEMTGTNWSKYTSHNVHRLELGVTSIPDKECPSDLGAFIYTFTHPEHNDSGLFLEGSEAGKVRMTPDGRYMVFESWGRLTPDDTDNVLDVYRYDFETGELKRLSFGHDGNDGNGNDNKFPVAGFNENGGFSGNGLAENGGRTMSTNGSQVLFQTAAPLSGHDVNEGPEPGECSGVEGTGCDVYQWEEQGHGTCTEAGGCISLISSGAAYHGGVHGVISSSGNDITFGTARELVPGDENGTGDLYDARVNGGFHAVHPRPPCPTLESCRPPREAEPAAPKFGTENFVSGGNNPEQLSCAKGKVRVIKHNQVRCVRKKKPHHKRHHHKRHHKRAGSRRGGAR